MPDISFNPDILNASTNTTAPAIRAYLGGSFDPVHNGHMHMAMYVHDCLLAIAKQQQRELHVSLLPNARSPFKTQSTDPAQRLVMLALATQDTPLQISELELWQTPPVYTIDTVRALRQRYPNDSLIFIMGMDSARSLEQWKDGLQLTDYVHLWIFDRIDNAGIIKPKKIADKNVNAKDLSNRKTTSLDTELPAALRTLIINNPMDLTALLNNLPKISEPLNNDPHLKNTFQGRIYIDSRPVLAISSTHIREQLQNADFNNNDANSPAKYLDSTVYQYIIAHQLYYADQFR